MNMPIANNSSFDQASIYSDLNSLDSIRKQGLTDETGAIKKAAKEFEAFFMNMLFKSMRQATDVIGQDSPFNSQQEKMFTSMLDEQMSVDLAQKGSFGIADLMVKQLTHHQTPPVRKTLESTSNQLEQISQGSQNISQVVAMKPVHTEKALTTLSNEKIEESTLSNAAIISNELPLNPVTKPEKKALFDDAKEFIQGVLPYAVDAAKKLSLDPRMLIAQAALETGWGKFIMHDDSGNPGFNLFGIKANSGWSGEKINVDTLEVENQQFKKINAAFRKYNNLGESFSDYVDFIQNNSRYQTAVELAKDANAFIEELQSAGYATDPDYAEKIQRIFNDPKVQSIKMSEE